MRSNSAELSSKRNFSRIPFLVDSTRGGNEKEDKITIELSIEELVESVSIPCVRASV